MPLPRTPAHWARRVVNQPRILGTLPVTTIPALIAQDSLGRHVLPRAEEAQPHQRILGEVLQVSHPGRWLSPVPHQELPGAVLRVSRLDRRLSPGLIHRGIRLLLSALPLEVPLDARVGRDLLHHGGHLLAIARVGHGLPRRGGHLHLVIARVGRDLLRHGGHLRPVLALLFVLLAVVSPVLETSLRLSLTHRVRLCLLTTSAAHRRVPESPSMTYLSATMPRCLQN